MNKVFIISEIKNLKAEEYMQYIDSIRIRRLDIILQRAIGTAIKCIQTSGISEPEAIINATQYGSYEQDQFVLQMVMGKNKIKLASHFMLSTPNTVATTIALYTHNHAYNCTYTQRKISYGLALQDAYLKIKAVILKNALVCVNDYVEGLEQFCRSEAVMLSSERKTGCRELTNINIQHDHQGDYVKVSTSEEE